MIEPGTYSLNGSTFRIGAAEYLLRERDQETKGKPLYYLVELPNRYVSSLWPQRDGRFRLDYRAADDTERVYYLTFGDDATVTLTGGEPSRRSKSMAPWQRHGRARS